MVEGRHGRTRRVRLRRCGVRRRWHVGGRRPARGRDGLLPPPGGGEPDRRERGGRHRPHPTRGGAARPRAHGRRPRGDRHRGPRALRGRRVPAGGRGRRGDRGGGDRGRRPRRAVVLERLRAVGRPGGSALHGSPRLARSPRARPRSPMSFATPSRRSRRRRRPPSPPGTTPTRRSSPTWRGPTPCWGPVAETSWSRGTRPSGTSPGPTVWIRWASPAWRPRRSRARFRSPRSPTSSRAAGVTTIYAEDLLPRDVVDTIAGETGAAVAVLNPIESLTPDQQAAGEDYGSLMRENLSTLVTGQDCG